ncbi:hypothetical protein Q7P37_004392 [Cladosporium fusiforme]
MGVVKRIQHSIPRDLRSRIPNQILYPSYRIVCKVEELDTVTREILQYRENRDSETVHKTLQERITAEINDKNK